MRKSTIKAIIILFLSNFAIYFYVRYYSRIYDVKHAVPLDRTYSDSTDEKHTGSKDYTKIVVSFVVCNGRLNQSLNVVKSLLLFTRAPIHLVIFADDIRYSQLNDSLTKWNGLTGNRLQVEIHKINFPKNEEKYWINLFRKCAAQRLFFPNLLPEIDAMIYVDVDTLFLGPVEELWDKFNYFNESQIAALVEEDNNANIAWYPRFARHPFYGKFGLNSGVMLMNLTRMREFGWMSYIGPISRKWKDFIPWGDQDIINIIFSFHERAVYVLSCRYNYRSDQCQHGDSCSDATARGVFLLHGSRSNFDKMPAFQAWTLFNRVICKSPKYAWFFLEMLSSSRDMLVGYNYECYYMFVLRNNSEHGIQAIYTAINEHELGTDPSEKLLLTMDHYMSQAPPSTCGDLKEAFLKVPKETFKSLYFKPNR